MNRSTSLRYCVIILCCLIILHLNNGWISLSANHDRDVYCSRGLIINETRNLLKKLLEEGNLRETNGDNMVGPKTGTLPHKPGIDAIGGAPMPICKAPMKLIGRKAASMTDIEMGDLKKQHPNVQTGHLKPTHCKPEQKLAIIIPYRDRSDHLRLWLQHMIPFLQRQERDATIYVVEQDDIEEFNAGMVRNIGFYEAKRRGEHDCYIFNDVDLLPEDDRNTYFCETNPVHLSGLVDRFQYILPYSEIVGGILSVTTSFFETVNGYSNTFFIWGGEDDNLFKRLVVHGYLIKRPTLQFSHCTSMWHPLRVKKEQRFKMLKKANDRVMVNDDGINSLKYKLISIEDKNLFVHIKVSINRTEFA